MNTDLTLRVLRDFVILLLQTSAMVLGGCTSAHITSTPSGADVFMSVGRGVTGQSGWEKRCQAPCSIILNDRFNKLKVQWPDNAVSDIQDADIDFFLFQIFDFHFVKPDLPAEQPKQIEWFSPVPLSTVPGSESCQQEE